MAYDSYSFNITSAEKEAGRPPAFKCKPFVWKDTTKSKPTSIPLR